MNNEMHLRPPATPTHSTGNKIALGIFAFIGIVLAATLISAFVFGFRDYKAKALEKGAPTTQQR